jgi:hypothetical protein
MCIHLTEKSFKFRIKQLKDVPKFGYTQIRFELHIKLGPQSALILHWVVNGITGVVHVE